MKQGRSIQELAAELDRQRETKRDFLVDTRALTLAPRVIEQFGSPATTFALEMNEVADGTFRVNDLAHRQVGQRCGIPAKYYDRMRVDAPELLADNVNHWWANQPEQRMVRTLDGAMRAFLGKTYRRIDNFDIAEAVLPTLNSKGARVESCQVTDTRMYIKAFFEGTEARTRRRGMVVRAGVLVQNSEVGLGSYVVQPMVLVLACLNGMVAQKHGIRGRHVGRRTSVNENEVKELYSTQTLKADDRALFLKLRDVVKASADEAKFQLIVDAISKAEDSGDLEDPVAAVELLQDRYGLLESEKGGILKHLATGGDMSLWGVSNAITRFSQDVDSYDRATELEVLGGEVIEMPRKQWREMAQAAA